MDETGPATLAARTRRARKVVAEGIAGILAGTTAAEAVLAQVAEVVPEAVVKICAGVPKLAIARHEAPLSQFSVKVANPDGHSRRCKPCQAADRLARRAGRTQGAQGGPRATTAEPVVVVDGTEAQAAEHAALEAAVAVAGGVGTDEGQQLLAQAAAAAQAAKRAAWADAKRRQRAAKAAAQVQAVL